VVRALAELGADIGARTKDGETPLQLSIHFGHHQAAQVLRELEQRERERSVRAKKEAATKKAAAKKEAATKEAAAKEAATKEAAAKKAAATIKPTQQAIEQAERMAALVIEEEEREEAAQRKVRGCSTLTLAELHGTRLDGVSIARGLSAS
jgi:hypothetical protein